MHSKQENISNKLQKKKETTTAFANVGFLTLAILVPAILIQTIWSAETSILSIQQTFAVPTPKADSTTSPQKTVRLDGVGLSFASNEDPTSGLSTILMKVTDEKTGFPLTHVDWVIKVISPDGKEVFKSSTIHSHLGVNQFSYKFFEPGENTVSVQVASLGPKMLGMDVPAPAHTRIFKSGDPMTGWKTDPSYFFGSRTTEFILDVGTDKASRDGAVSFTDNGINAKPQDGSNTNLDGVKILDGSEKGTKVKLELSTIPKKIVSGKPATLVLNVKRADNGTLVTHPDALVAIGASAKLVESGPPGNPMIPINGAFHGHSGEKVITTIFPSTGKYTIDMDVYSIPVSNYNFGHVKTSFEVNVDKDEGGAKDTEPSQVSNTTTAIPITNELNHVAIIGQDVPYYNPDRITIKPGTTLTFRNHDAIIHTVTGTDNGNSIVSPTSNNSFDTGVLATGQEKQVTFDKAGIFNYFCAVHPFMRGIVSVIS